MTLNTGVRECVDTRVRKRLCRLLYFKTVRRRRRQRTIVRCRIDETRSVARRMRNSRQVRLRMCQLANINYMRHCSALRVSETTATVLQPLTSATPSHIRTTFNKTKRFKCSTLEQYSGKLVVRRIAQSNKQ